MSKFQYPKEGIRALTNAANNDTINQLQAAINECNFDVPYSFPYRQWIYELKSSLQNQKKVFVDIQTIIDKTDKNMKTTEQDSKNRIKAINSKKLEEIERTIV